MRRTEQLPYRDPVEVFAALGDRPGAALLCSASSGRGDSGRSVIVVDPVHTLVADAGTVRIDGRPTHENPFTAWSAMMRERQTAPLGAAIGAPFGTGAVGFVGYEAAPYVDPAMPAIDSTGLLPALAVGLYDAALVFDADRRRLHGIEYRTGKGAATLRAALASVADEDSPARVGPVHGRLVRPPDGARFRGSVMTAKERILAGDFFQANLTHLLEARLEPGPAPIDVFRRMLAADPAPMAAFFRAERGAVASISPERMLRAHPTPQGLRVFAEPIKGTAPRASDPERDRASASALLRSDKDRAENVMIVDLVRNDLARVARDGSVDVLSLCELRSFPGVHHLVSEVTAVARPEATAVDVLRALFPSGSITGAPKIEAMRFIARAEAQGRGVYTGAIGYVDDGGGADFSVAIRTAEIDPATDGLRVRYGVGGGITQLSDAEAEYRETLDKASTFLRALDIVGVDR